MIELGRKESDDPVLEAEPAKVISPAKWQGASMWLEGSSPERYLVTWKQPETESLKKFLINPGETLSGFVIISSKPSSSFLKCPFTVSFLSGDSYSGFMTGQQ